MTYLEFCTNASILQSGDGTMQKKAYSCLGTILSCTDASHEAFIVDHTTKLQQILLESLSTSSAASKKVNATMNSTDYYIIRYALMGLLLELGWGGTS